MATKSSAPAMVAHRAMVTMLMSGWVTLRAAGVGQAGEVIGRCGAIDDRGHEQG